jgi:hypothetical protein
MRKDVDRSALHVAVCEVRAVSTGAMYKFSRRSDAAYSVRDSLRRRLTATRDYRSMRSR